MTFALRAYDVADFEAMSALDQACFPRGIAYSRRELRWYLESPGADCVVAHAVTTAGDQLAGFILTEAEGAGAHIITLDVAEAYRRSGVGSALLDEAERRLAARGVETVDLETAINNDAAIALWQQHGYETVDVLKRYYLNRLDAYLMRKRLPQKQTLP